MLENFSRKSIDRFLETLYYNYRNKEANNTKNGGTKNERN